MVPVELIDELKKRANISYAEAKRILEENNGDLLESLITIENKKKNESGKNLFLKMTSRIKRGFLRGNQLKVIVVKDGETLVKLPITYVLLATVFGFYLILISLGIIFLSKCRVYVKEEVHKVKNGGGDKNG
jgi:hypothetical protein